MKIYVVSRCVDRKDEQSSTTVSAHVDKGWAQAAADRITHHGEFLTYGVVESVELDLTGVTHDEAIDVATAAGYELVI